MVRVESSLRHPSAPIIATPNGESIAKRISRIAHDELRDLRPGLLAANAALAMLPNYTLCRVRTRILRLAGFDIGYGSSFFGAPRIGGGGDIVSRLHVGRNCAINADVTLDLGAEITIGDQVSIGHQVMILTASHKLGPPTSRAGRTDPLPVRIGDGAWICARATLLAGVTIGAGAVVSAGAVVNKDVPPNSIVAGVPARVIVPRIR